MKLFLLVSLLLVPLILLLVRYVRRQAGTASDSGPGDSPASYSVGSEGNCSNGDGGSCGDGGGGGGD